MANSKQLRYLKKRINELRKNMLPKKFSPTGDYSERILDRARGFRVLCHAEIEAYLEEIAMETIKEKIKDLKSKSKPSYTVLSFLASYHTGWAQDGKESIIGAKSRIKPKEKMEEAIDNAHKQYIATIIKGNNGIKISNLKSIFIPLGIDFDKVDSTWLTNVDNYGKIRGEVAHQSKKVQKQIDPKTELDSID
jgi:hypothetical protein